MTPQLSTYEAAARGIYEPQKQAEQIALTATRDTTKTALEAQKGQVTTNYQQAIDKLTQSVQDQTGQINQLYSQRLGGNFSGLQGNDLGQMFSRANQQQGYIESTRANKLNEITTGETNADINYGAGVASLTPKYQSLETQYAQSAYGGAVKDYQDNQYKQQQLALSYARLNNSAPKTPTKQETAQMIRQGLTQNGIRGKDGYVSPQDYARAYKDWLGAGYTIGEFNNYFGDLKNPNNGYYDYEMSKG